MVSTGDQAEDKVSRQMAPCTLAISIIPSFRLKFTTYCLTADVWMPNFRLKLHDGRPEGILRRYSDVNDICSSFIRGSWRPLERSFEMHDIISISSNMCRDL